MGLALYPLVPVLNKTAHAPLESENEHKRLLWTPVKSFILFNYYKTLIYLFIGK